MRDTQRISLEDAKALLSEWRAQEAQECSQGVPQPNEALDRRSLFYDRLQSRDAAQDRHPLLALDLRKQRPAQDSPEERRLVDEAFAYYRSAGFPFPTWTDESLRQAFSALCRTPSAIRGKNIVANTVGLGAATAFHPAMYDVRCRGRQTPREVFSDDELFRSALVRRVRRGDNLRPYGVRQSICTSPGCQSASNFRPAAARSIYEMFGASFVLDFCMGWGGRLLGAIAAGVPYVGIDPSTAAVRGNREMLCHLRRLRPDVDIDATIVWGCAEDVLGHGIFQPDLVFTSPPYFDAEHYSDEITQSYLRYPTEDGWYECFLTPCIEGAAADLQPGGHLVLNVAHDMTAKVTEIASSAGLHFSCALKLGMASRPGPGKGRASRFEDVIALVKAGAA